METIGSAVQVQQSAQVLDILVPADYPAMLVTLVIGLPFFLVGLVLLIRLLRKRSSSLGLVLMMASFLLTPCLMLGLEYDPSHLVMNAQTGVVDLRQVRWFVPRHLVYRLSEVTGARVNPRENGDTLYLLLGASAQPLSGFDFMPGKDIAARAISDFVRAHYGMEPETGREKPVN